MQRLGGSVISMDEYSSSAKKGETIEDSVQVYGVGLVVWDLGCVDIYFTIPLSILVCWG